MIFPNCENSYFSYRFKRKPKQWDTNSLHELYLKLVVRSKQRYKDLWDYIKYLKTVLPKTDISHSEKGYIVYFNSGKSIRYYALSKDGYSIRDVNEDRDGKISLILVNDEMLAMGNKMKRLVHLSEPGFKWKVAEVLNRYITDAIREHNDKKGRTAWHNPDKIHIVEIQGCRYMFKMSKGITEAVREEDVIKI